MKTFFRLSFGACLLTVALLPVSADAGTLFLTIAKLGEHDGRAWIISRTDFRTCARSGRQDPWNREACLDWLPIGAGRHSRSGYFCVQARWPGGRLARDGFDLGVAAAAEHRLTMAPRLPGPDKGEC